MKYLLYSILLFLYSALSAQNITEEFEDSATVVNNGWVTLNNSNPAGPTSWFAGNTTVFTAHSQNGYFAANYNSCSGSGTISTWLISPVRWFRNGDSILFYTRTVDSSLIPTFPDRLQLRFSPNGTGLNVGANASDTGDFTQSLLDINPTYDSTGYPNGYPCHWKKYMVILSGLPAQGVSGRFAFRYFIENGGPLGSRSDYIGIDSCAYRTPTNGVNESEPFRFSVFPNPVQQGQPVSIQSADLHTESNLEILDATGRIIFTCSFRDQIFIDTRSWAAGLFHIRLVNKDGTVSRSLIIR
ncbi:MAG: T9SS type A sorting domain-containing protein [Bacteroidia bacterium]|nr:T9SS type A sorting domain-containing protein [Bacteroidia bacterium]